MRGVQRDRVKINLIGFTFNFSYIMLSFLIPLDAHALGYSLVAIGLITGLPGACQMPLRVLSGPLSDRYGERRLLLASFACGVAGSVAVAGDAGGLWAMLVAQLAIGTARGFFWVAAQSYVARLPGERANALGVFTSMGQAGSISGIVCAGPFAVFAGFGPAFALCAALQAVSLALAWVLADLPLRELPRPLGESLRAMPRLLRRPAVRLSGTLNVVAAIPQALVQSFYPVYLVELGLAASAVSGLTALRSVGVLLAGFLFARLYRRLGTGRISTLGTVALGLALAATASRWVGVVGAAIFAAGAVSGVVTVLATVIVVEASEEQDQGRCLALTNLGYASSMFATPLAFGFAGAHLGQAATFAVMGALVVAAGLALWAAAAAGWGRRWQVEA